ncbi:MAG TPA: sigma-70 family RNA polymerase sigma factor [Dehalococcoidia bacterium]|nr:sigma-70 family RNA polymerase sigma factor [Dehalococcoidia bacterium]
MIEDNLPLVAYVVSRMTDMLAAGMMDKEDAHSYGVEGLIQAVDNFDVTRGNTFGTFAMLRIRGSILDAIRRHDVLPRTLRKKLRDVENANLELANRLGRWPTTKELSLYAHMSISEVRDVMEHRGTRMFSLEKSMDNEAGQDTMTWDVEDKSERDDPVAHLDRQDLLGILERAVGSLSDRDRQIVELRYKRSLSISAIGRMLNVSESRVSQLHKRILASLQRQMSAEMDPAA